MPHARRKLLAAALAAFSILVVGLPSAATAQEAPAAYPGHSYGVDVRPGPSADKPQSKVWHHDGAWWAVMLNSSDQAFHIYRLGGDHSWNDTGTVLDSRATSHADVLSEGDDLYVVSTADSGRVTLHRLSYEPGAGSYAVDAGFPIEIGGDGPETVTIAKDTTGTLWVTFEQNRRILVAHSTTDDATWTAPYELPVPNPAVTADDISAVVALNGQIGVMWSDQASDAMRFATHEDGAPDGEWTAEIAQSGPEMADDHINVKVAADGTLYAAVKTSKTPQEAPSDDPGTMLLVRDRAGSWSGHVYSTVGDRLTRPIVSLDDAGRRVLFFASRESGGPTAYYEETAMDSVSFSAGPGAELMSFPGAEIDDLSTTKQAVDSQAGAVVIGSDEPATRYYHAEVSLAPTQPPPLDAQPPTVPAGLTARAESATSVALSWTASSDDTGVDRYTVYRDGQEIGQPRTTDFRDDTARAGTTYTYTVDAVDATGNHSAQSDPATATTPAEPPQAGIEFRDAAFGANRVATTLTLGTPSDAVAGDVLVAAVDVRGKTGVTAPAGWTVIRIDSSGSALTKALFLRRVGASEPASHTWRFSKSQAAAGGIAAYDGVSSVTPLDAAGGQPNAASTSIVAPSIATTVSGTRVVGFFGTATGTTIQPPAGFTERGEAAATAGQYDVTTEIADVTSAGSGPTGSHTAKAARKARNVGQLVALRPER